MCFGAWSLMHAVDFIKECVFIGVCSVWGARLRLTVILRGVLAIPINKIQISRSESLWPWVVLSYPPATLLSNANDPGSTHLLPPQHHSAGSRLRFSPADFAASFIILDISTLPFSEKKKKKKNHIPSGSGTLHSDSCWLTLSLSLSRFLVSNAAPPGFNKQRIGQGVCGMGGVFVYMHGCLYVSQFERWAGNETHAPSTTTTTNHHHHRHNRRRSHCLLLQILNEAAVLRRELCSR